MPPTYVRCDGCAGYRTRAGESVTSLSALAAVPGRPNPPLSKRLVHVDLAAAPRGAGARRDRLPPSPAMPSPRLLAGLQLLLTAGRAAGAASGGADAPLAPPPVAWVAESADYARLLQQKVATSWDIKWCGANGARCRAGDPGSAGVRAVIGRPA